MEQLDTKEVSRLQSEIESVQSRFFHLLSITTIVMLVLAGGFVLRLFPKMLWGFDNLQDEKYYVPQLLFGLLGLVGLLGWYVMQQRWHLKSTQKQLISELIRREAAERLVVVDPLTEIYNRRFIMRAIESETSRANRHGSEFAFLMIDVNGFKQVNDEMGHLVGDRILRELGTLLRKTLRASDIVSRYGGDEFLVLLVDTNQQMASRAMERVQAAVDAWNLAEPIKGYAMSVSCGTAVYEKGADAIAVLAAADQAMYQNKFHASMRNPSHAIASA
jgi:diguanylate cyclase (GGDEF)-like protein